MTTLTAEDLALLARVDEEFADCGETEVPYEALMDFAQRGYLRCERFAFTDKGAQAVFAAVNGSADGSGVEAHDERQQFERAMRVIYPAWTFDVSESGCYRDNLTFAAWMAWQSSRGVVEPQQTIPGVKEDQRG